MNGPECGSLSTPSTCRLKKIAKHDWQMSGARRRRAARGWDDVVHGFALNFAGIFVDHFVPASGGALVFGAPVSEDGIDQIADGVDLGRDRVRHIGAYLLVERNEQFDALHRIEAEIELQVVVGLRRSFLQLGRGLDDAKRLG